MLAAVGERLNRSVRDSDCVARQSSEESYRNVARLGGDEFTVLVKGMRQVEDAASISRRILELLSKPLTIGGHEIHVTPSIGISVFPMDGADGDTLIKHADMAMYKAKVEGRNNYQFYTAS